MSVAVSAGPFSRRATLIGGNGFVGRHLHRRLQAENWECRVVGNGDALDPQSDLGVVFYCAGLTADYAVRPFDTVNAHVERLSDVLQAGRFESLVYLSSTRLYDSQPDLDAHESASLVVDPGNPRHIYDLSKGLGESLCHVTGHGRARIARLSCVVNDETDTDGFLPALLRRAIAHRKTHAGATLSVDSSAAYARDYIGMDDVVDALIAIATRGTQVVYNVGSGENVSNRQLFDTIAQEIGCAVEATIDAVAPLPPRISIQRMREEFDWQPTLILQRVKQLLKDASHA